MKHVFRSFAAPLSITFLLGIFTTKTHPKGILVGTITSQLILVLKTIGLFSFPTPSEVNDLVSWNDTLCSQNSHSMLSGIDNNYFRKNQTILFFLTVDMKSQNGHRGRVVDILTSIFFSPNLEIVC